MIMAEKQHVKICYFAVLIIHMLHYYVAHINIHTLIR